MVECPSLVPATRIVAGAADISHTCKDNYLVFYAFRIHEQLVIRDDSGHSEGMIQGEKPCSSADMEDYENGSLVRSLEICPENY
jgi:hypothetical protein